MVILKHQGGIGNQMFQIALYYSLNKNRDVKLDLFGMENYLNRNNWAMAIELFGINPEIATKNDFMGMNIHGDGFINRICRKVLSYRGKIVYENNEGNYDESIFYLDNVYLDGYWQSYKYFENNRTDLLKLFSFPCLSGKSLEFENEIVETEIPISVHIRMGDYLQGANKAIYGGICTEEYYNKAINFFKEKYPKCHFYIFSNDKHYVQKYKNRQDFTLIDCNDEKDAWKDMYLMSICKHNIIANSSFSWWGAWLNQHEDKEIIAPYKWMNTKEMRDIYPNEWIRI